MYHFLCICHIYLSTCLFTVKSMNVLWLVKVSSTVVEKGQQLDVSGTVFVVTQFVQMLESSRHKVNLQQQAIDDNSFKPHTVIVSSSVIWVQLWLKRNLNLLLSSF